jgi:hypothetical protein
MRRQFSVVESMFNAMALAIQGLVVCDDDLSVLAWWDARGDALGFERRSEAIAVMASLGEQFACARQGVDRQAAPLWSFICPSESTMMMGRPWPSHTAWSLEFSPTLVRPMRRGRVFHLSRVLP